MQLNILTLLLLGLTSAFAQRLGDTCQANDECPSTILCDNNVCGGPGACTPDNSSPDGTGLSDQCDRYQICVSNMCDTRIPNGLPCNDPQQCNSDICQLGKCSDGSCSSDSDCPFQCINNQCFKFCDTDSDCPGGLACAGNGRCGDVGASCFPNVYSTDNVGISEQCSSTLTCIDFLCTTPGPNGLGDSCFSAKDCDQSSLHCLRGTCSDLSPALPGDTCEVDQQCIEDGTSCIDYQCGTAPNPGQSEKPIPRRNLQLPWLQAKCARPGDVACPVAGINSRNAYEVSQKQRGMLTILVY